MDRRRFPVGALAGALAVLDVPRLTTGSAQTGAKSPAIAYLGKEERLAEFAKELVGLNVDVIVARWEHHRADRTA